ncbi:MAG: SDR family oxidoreductase [Gammaproteobacteria bacterium]
MSTKPTVLVTGGSRGIGAATTRLLARRGYRVCINFRHDVHAAKALTEELAEFDPVAVQADVSNERDIMKLFETIDIEFGALTALVNNAGVLSTQTRVEQLTAERINWMFTNNVTSAFLCAREAVKRMSKARGGKGGSIVNVSSVAAQTGAPCEYVDYAASKGALDALTRGLSKEVAAEGIRVNSVRPGFIQTGIHADGGEPNRINRLKENIPMKRGGTPEEIALSIAWLLSEEASYCTGTFINAAGGT